VVGRPARAVLGQRGVGLGRHLRRQRAQPDWPARVAAAHTLPREAQAVRHYPFAPGPFAGLRVPTLLLLGSESPPFFTLAIEALAAAVPHSQVRVLAGQHHNAMETAPALLAEAVLQFVLAVP
jgi:pimeloyl-ACP methyl ester carboxylesterase